MIEIDEITFLDISVLELIGNDCISLEDQFFYRQQLLAQMLGWA